jgi:hypothetical protein
MRTQTRRFTGIIILAVVLGISGCKMPLANEPDGSTGGKQVTLTISTGTVNARTVTVQEGDINIASYKLTAVQGSTSRKTIALSETDFNSAPEAPSDLTASREVMSTTVNLSWTDNSTNETAFEIQYSDDDGSNWNDLSTDVSPGATGYDDEGLTRGTTRSYRILAVNGFGASEYSDTAAVTVPWLVTFDKDSEDAVGAMDSEEAADDGTITLPAGTFSRDCYTFAGWTTDRESVMSWPKVPEYDDGKASP